MLYLVLLLITIRAFHSIKDEPAGSPKVHKTLIKLALLWIVSTTILLTMQHFAEVKA